MRARMSFRSLFLTGFAITILGLGALAAAILTLQWSTQQYARRADMAQRQALLLAHIDAEAAELLLTGAATARASLDRAAAAYLSSIDEETVLIDAKGDDYGYQLQEAATAQRLVGLLQRHPAALADARRLARQIAVRENAEADEAATQARQAERDAWRVISGIIALLIALPLGIAALLWRQLIRPLDALVRATRSIATEGAPVPLPASRLSEMRQLIDHFGDMARAVDIRVRGRTAQLEALNRRLAETDQRRRLFLSKVSHELRTPMTVMRGEAEVALRLNSDAAGLRDALHQILDSNRFLERRLNDLLTLARAEDGALPLRVDRVDLADLARQAGQTAAAFAMASGVRLELADLEQAMPVMGDPDRLRQAILALIDNGVKFSPPGGRLRLSGDRGRGQMGVMIADEGPGVADGDLDRIFDPYVQGDAGRSLGGTGLGLSLARWIAQAHRGTIKARNGTKGEGLCVSLRLPGLM